MVLKIKRSLKTRCTISFSAMLFNLEHQSHNFLSFRDSTKWRGKIVQLFKIIDPIVKDAFNSFSLLDQSDFVPPSLNNISSSVRIYFIHLCTCKIIKFPSMAMCFLIFVSIISFTRAQKSFRDERRLIYVDFSERLMTDFHAVSLRSSFVFKSNLTAG